jgi:hypothetical protein
VETVHKGTSLRSVPTAERARSICEQFRGLFIMELATRYSLEQIAWDEYVRTAEVVDSVLRQIADELGSAA